MIVLRRLVDNSGAGLRALVRPPRIPPERRTPLWPVKGRIVFAALLAILLVAGSMVLLDAYLITQARQLPSWVRQTFEWITKLGNSGWFLYPTGILMLVIAASPWEKLPRFSKGVLATISVRVSFIFLAVGAPALFVTIIKRLIGRARPYVADIMDPYSFAPLIWKSSYASLPSGHATNAFAAAIAIGSLWPKARLPMWIFAVVIAISRVIVNAHFPSDVIAGAFVGVAGALFVRSWYAARNFGFTVGCDGVIHRWPGPSWRRVKEVARKLLGQ
jgi:membrane-associated phospholipid phosphatase